MKYARIEFREYVPVQPHPIAPVNRLLNVEGTETALGIELGAVLIPWSAISAVEREPIKQPGPPAKRK